MIRYLIWLGAYPRLVDDRYIELDYPYERVDVELVERYEVSNPGNEISDACKKSRLRPNFS